MSTQTTVCLSVCLSTCRNKWKPRALKAGQAQRWTAGQVGRMDGNTDKGCVLPPTQFCQMNKKGVCSCQTRHHGHGQDIAVDCGQCGQWTLDWVDWAPKYKVNEITSSAENLFFKKHIIVNMAWMHSNKAIQSKALQVPLHFPSILPSIAQK